MSRGSLLFLAALVSGAFVGCSDEPGETVAPSLNPDNIVITVDRTGKMYLNGKPVQNEQDILALLAKKSANENPPAEIPM